MRKFVVLLSLSAGSFSQSTISIPFDWVGQNGIVITDGALFWNKDWTSGMLFFDGTYTSYPKRYGSYTYQKFQPTKTGIFQKFSDLPDSNNVESYFDYNRGDYLYNQMEIGADYEEPNRLIQIRGFKRNHGGNTGHYLHPSGGTTTIHHSYLVNYGAKKGGRILETSAGRFVTRSGLPDSTTNGLENENIINAGVRYQRPLGNWTMDSYVGKFFQHRLIHHSSMVDSNYHDINRGRINIQIESPGKMKFGLIQESQQVNDIRHNRALSWTKLYSAKSFENFSLMGGLQLLNSDDSFPFLFSVNYFKKFKTGYLKLSSDGSSKPKHPDLDDPTDKSSFEFWNNSVFQSGYNKNGLDINGSLSLAQKRFDSDEDEKILFASAGLEYIFKNEWSVYSNVMTQLDSSIYGGGFGTFSSLGLKGKLYLFKNNMKIDAHLWANGLTGRLSTFGFDPVRQIPFNNTNTHWILPDQWLLHFKVVANISGVLVTYKVNNMLNAIGSIGGAPTGDLVWLRPNHVYPKLGRMMQFGVTWTFKN